VSVVAIAAPDTLARICVVTCDLRAASYVDGPYRSHEILARERRQTEDSHYYEKEKGCLYGPGIADLR